MPDREKDLGSDASRAIGTVKCKSLFYRPDVGQPCPAERNRLVARQFLAGFFKECGRWHAFTPQQPMDSLRGAVALLFVITKQNLPVASSQYQSRAQSGRSAADDDHIEFHAEHLSFATLMGCFAGLGTPSACSFVRYSRKKIMPRARTAANWKELTPEERRERRQLRREKQREDNIGRAAKMHAVRLRMRAESPEGPPELKKPSMSDAQAGVTGNGGIRFMWVCHRQIGSSTT